MSSLIMFHYAASQTSNKEMEWTSVLLLMLSAGIATINGRYFNLTTIGI